MNLIDEYLERQEEEKGRKKKIDSQNDKDF